MFGTEIFLKYTVTCMCRDKMKLSIKQFPIDLNQPSSLDRYWERGWRNWQRECLSLWNISFLQMPQLCTISYECKHQLKRARKSFSRDFPDDPVIKTLHFHCRGRRFDPWSGNLDLACHAEQPKIFKSKEKKILKSFSL